MSDESLLLRLHVRIDSLITELSGLSQRVARIEVQESRVSDNARDIDRLQQRCENLVRDLFELKSASSPKSKAIDYAGKGGLVVSGGAVVEIIRWIVQALKN